MSFRSHIDIGNALRRIADKRIEDAIKEGKFDNLPGAGKPLDLEPAPADENAKAAWLAMRLFKQNEITPDEFVWRKQIDQLRPLLVEARSEQGVRTAAEQINKLVYKINTLGTAATGGVFAVDVEAAVRRWRSERP